MDWAQIERKMWAILFLSQEFKVKIWDPDHEIFNIQNCIVPAPLMNF